MAGAEMVDCAACDRRTGAVQKDRRGRRSGWICHARACGATGGFWPDGGTYLLTRPAAAPDKLQS